MVLIPLLVDDPLWDYKIYASIYNLFVLIPLLVDDPLWAILIYSYESLFF